MRGSVQRQRRSWTAYWSAVDTQTGQPKQRTKGGFHTRADAIEHLNETVAAVSAGSYVEPSKTSLGRYMTNEWLPAIAGTVRPNTIDVYSRLTRGHIAGRAIGGIALRDLTGGRLNAHYRELEQHGLSVNTRRLIH
jgi:hypothetical protein